MWKVGLVLIFGAVWFIGMVIYYDQPLGVKWPCFKHHKIYENPELLEKS